MIIPKSIQCDYIVTQIMPVGVGKLMVGVVGGCVCEHGRLC